ncbi:ADP-ribosylglycohydrolase family protein [Dysgonomonas sp. HGC4]|uniref:ADP-ribosylglycohydrolase family protein n=1 Tax=Dysgonomonas sp. HGC4 TaxID=1658009 RepID=UPI000B0A578D|nr:ADP-ribosylglycohydrolase family protein [Dysgonomonas sp. HGC4]
MDHLRVLPIEYLQSKEEGKNILNYQQCIDEIMQSDTCDLQKEEFAGNLLDEMYNLPIDESFPYKEPSTLKEIKALRPVFAYKNSNTNISPDKLFDKIYGAWLGRCTGCLLGQPIEGWKLAQIRELLKDTNNYPLTDYISSNIKDSIKEKHSITDQYYLFGNKPITINWINNITRMPEDDDINYTIASLHILETYGWDFNSDDVAESWLLNIPLLHTYTAERIAYRNLSLYKFPPLSAVYRNPYREWIGAQIRGDFWGYINGGDIEMAAEMAFRDASVSHVKNGIYGEMFVSAMIAAAMTSDDIEFIINCGLSQIPATCRLTEYVNIIVSAKNNGWDEEQVIAHIHTSFDEKQIHHWCHTIPNAMIVCFALLYGNKDFEKSLSLAIMSAFDTDCNAATVGSIIGLIRGASQIPLKWTPPLNDTVCSGVRGFDEVSISSLAQRTIDIILEKEKTKCLAHQ